MDAGGRSHRERRSREVRDGLMQRFLNRRIIIAIPACPRQAGEGRKSPCKTATRHKSGHKIAITNGRRYLDTPCKQQGTSDLFRASLRHREAPPRNPGPDPAMTPVTDFAARRVRIFTLRALAYRDAGGRAASGTKAKACTDARLQGCRAASGTKAEINPGGIYSGLP